MRENVEGSISETEISFSDGNLRGYHCADGAGADIWRYEFLIIIIDW